MTDLDIIKELEDNASVFEGLLKNKSNEEYLWKAQPEKWCLLEIICHLRDEEVEDFRTRTQHTLEARDGQPPAIDPVGWVADRKYVEQDYETVLADFLDQRNKSIEWLNSLQNPTWSNGHMHPTLGKRTAKMYFHNWLAHDYMHIRQILRLNFEYLRQNGGQDLSYAGNW